MVLHVFPPTSSQDQTRNLWSSSGYSISELGGVLKAHKPKVQTRLNCTALGSYPMWPSKGSDQSFWKWLKVPLDEEGHKASIATTYPPSIREAEAEPHA